MDFHSDRQLSCLLETTSRWNQEEQQRWISIFPWLKGNKGLTDKLTEEEAWTFLTEASDTLLSLGVDILLPSWWMR